MALNKVHADLVDPPVIQATEKGATEGKILVLDSNNCFPKEHIETGTGTGDIPVLGSGGKLGAGLIDTGTNVGQIIEVATGDKLPVIDGSNLTGLAAVGEVNTAENVGGSYGPFKEKDGTKLVFKSLSAGANITLGSGTDIVSITAPAPGETNTASNVGSGNGTEFGLFQQKTGSDLEFRKIKEGANVTLIDNPNDLMISVDAPGETNTATNLGDGDGEVFTSKSGVTLQLRSIKAGTGITVANNTNDITIAASAPGETNTASNVGGGEGVFKEKTGTDLVLRSIVGGSNVTLEDNDNDITINGAAPGETNTASNVGGGQGIWKSKTGTNLELRSIVAGSNVTLGNNDNDITISVPAPGETNTASNLGSGAGLFTEKSGVTIQLKSIVAGTGITITNNTNDITISASGGGGGYTPIAGAILQEQYTVWTEATSYTSTVDAAGRWNEDTSNADTWSVALDDLEVEIEPSETGNIIKLIADIRGSWEDYTGYHYYQGFNFMRKIGSGSWTDLKPGDSSTNHTLVTPGTDRIQAAAVYSGGGQSSKDKVAQMQFTFVDEPSYSSGEVIKYQIIATNTRKLTTTDEFLLNRSHNDTDDANNTNYTPRTYRTRSYLYAQEIKQ